MKKKFIRLILLKAAAVFIAAFCAGTPLLAQTAADGSSLLPEYEKKAAELNDARSAAVDAGAEDLVPGYLQEADSAFDDAGAKYQAKDYDGARASAAGALTMYQALKNGLDAYYLREEIEEAADELVPAYLQTVDAVGLDAIDKWEAKDYPGAKAGADDALSKYLTLGDGLDAYYLREEIEDEADDLVPGYIQTVDTVGLNAIDKWEAKDYPGAKAGADDALSMYLTLGDGLVAYNVREEIEEAADELVPGYLQTVDAVGLDAIDKWEAEDYPGAKAGADDALSMYLTINDGLVAYFLREEIADIAEELVPEALQQADTVGLDAIDKWDAKDYSGAKLGAAQALTMFSGLRTAWDAYALREEIADRAEQLFSDYLSKADDVALDAIDKWEAEDYPAAKEYAVTAWIMYLCAASFTERQTAINLKADMAARQEFFSAEAIFNRANAAYNRQNYEEAAPLYEECLFAFRMTTLLALEKQRAAEEALRRANQRAAESYEAARNAELILQGGRR